jgi:hypothetical protein
METNSPKQLLRTPVGDLLSRLKEWMSIAEFEAAMNAYFSGPRLSSEIADYRAKRGAFKQLRDEVTPVLNYVRLINAKGEIRFELGNEFPDCWIRSNASGDPKGLEVTGALSRERHLLATELNEKGVGRGHLGLPDNAPSRAFSARLASPRVMYSSESALKQVVNGIKACLEKKAKTKYAGYILLIEAPLRKLPKERWIGIEDELRLAAREMPFSEVHVIGDQESPPFGFQIR